MERIDCLEHELELGQIRYLYLWVHPQWQFWGSVEREIGVYKKFIDKLRDAPHVGLLQIADAPRPEFKESKGYMQFIEELRKIDEYAAQAIGGKYSVWDATRFFDGNNPEHVAGLVKRFSLVANNQEAFVRESERNCMDKEPKYLAKIYVFGKERDTCPLEQAYHYGMTNLASIVRYFSYETPEHLDPPTKENPKNRDGEGVIVFPRTIDKSNNCTYISLSF